MDRRNLLKSGLTLAGGTLLTTKASAVSLVKEMPARNDLKDNEIAAVLTYVRNSFGNNASSVSSILVKKVRVNTK